MNKSFFILVGIIFLLGINIISAAEIGYVVKNTGNPNQEIISVLNDKGYDYELIDDSDIPSTDFSNYEMILVWDETLDHFEDIPVNEMKTLVGNLNYLEEWDLAGSISSRTSTGYEYGKMIEDNAITEGSLEIIQLYDERGTGLDYLPKFLNRARGIETIVARNHYDANPLIGIIPVGGELYNGGSSEATTLIFTLTKSDHWTPDSKILFENSIKWLIGEDSDGDGYYNDVDCDDEDDSINPGSTDIYKNCINDAPIVDLIDKIEASEGETIEIVVEAIDPENDELTYEIDNGLFEVNENLLTWTPGFEDYGYHLFTISVSDGEFIVEIEVEVEVSNTNRIPICNEIPKLTWVEDENASLNLNDYCSDPDGENIVFVVEVTSEETFITLINLENGIANFSSEKDWNGDDWIIFKITDGKSYSLTNKIVLEVTPVNDAPSFEGIINDIIWDEDEDLENFLDLNDYFSDVDSELTFEVNGNTNILITIENGIVSLFPDEDWFGQESIVFTASDGEYNLNSNTITLNVLDKNEPPKIIDESDFEVTLNEDFGSWDFDLTAYESDFEDTGEDLIWSIDYIDGDFNVEITDINEDILTISSIKDKTCLDECGFKLIVTDSEGMQDREYFSVYILPVNDGPTIEGYSPKENIKIIENRDKLFEITVRDIDSNIQGYWYLDEVFVGNGFNYLMNQGAGNYDLKVTVSDGEFNVSHSWEVVVGDIGDFRCEQVGGFVFNEHETCLGDLLGVYDIDNCCAVPASFGFNDVGRCEIISNNIEITINDPDDGDEFKPGDLIKGEIKLRNDFDEDKDFDVEVYLYDLTKDNDIEEYTDSLKNLDEGSREDIKFEIQIPKDLDAKNNYAIFIKIIEDDDEYCNNEFIEINIEREEDNLVFEDIEIGQEVIECGDYIEIKTKIKNWGDEDQDAYIIIENSELNFSQKSNLFEIEEYDEDDEWIETFDLMVPENIPRGEYELDVSIIFADKRVLETKTVIVSECKILEQKINSVEQIELGINNEEANIKDKSKIYLIVGSIATILLLILIILMILFMI